VENKQGAEEGEQLQSKKIRQMLKFKYEERLKESRRASTGRALHSHAKKQVECAYYMP
jgi:hypothetical protein